MDPSPLGEAAQASSNANQPGQTEPITFMDLKYHNAAVKGEFEKFYEVQPSSLKLLLTPNKNTILHIYITAIDNRKPESKTEFVTEVLKRCPELLQQPNEELETPLHIAARYGHVHMVKTLIDRAKDSFTDLESQVDPVKEMLGMKTREEDTAMHEAVRYNHLKVVESLIKEDPDFKYFANKAGETILYMAVERRFRKVAFKILETCNSQDYTGPLGRTAFHAAVYWDDQEMIEKLPAKVNGLAKKDADKRWTPLHWAAHLNKSKVVKQLLKHGREAAYIKDAEGRTALHIAAHMGHYKIVEEIISKCPDCCELVDNEGRNILHAAAEGKRSPATVRVIVSRLFLSNLFNEKDNKGNTPLLRHSNSTFRSIRSFVVHPRIDTKAFNNENLNFRDIALTNEEASITKWRRFQCMLWMKPGRRPASRKVIELDYTLQTMHKKEQKKAGSSIYSRLEKGTEAHLVVGSSLYSCLEKGTEPHLVVAALITTVTFAAGITMPGGFMGEDDSLPGSAILGKNTAFRAFIITDAVSMALSSLAVFTHMLLPLPWLNKPNQFPVRKSLHSLAFYSILLALGTMVLAFVTGTYAVLADHSSYIAIAVCIIALFFIPIFCIRYRRIVRRMGWCLSSR